MFEFDPDGGSESTLPENKIQTQESANDRRQAKSVVKVDFSLCEETGVCTDVCPEDVFEFSGGHTKIVNPQNCTECWICVEHCVSSAIEIG